MGGYGSGRWHLNVRTTVEETLKLPIRAINDTLKQDRMALGTLTWKTSGSVIGYRFEPGEGAGIVWLDYTMKVRGEAENISYFVKLEKTPCNFGGFRYWFVCPLIKNGVPCARRCGKLYKPGYGKYFGCRICYDLTYRSSQESHKFDALYKTIASQMGCDFQTIRRALSR